MADISNDSDLVNLDSSTTLIQIANPYLLSESTQIKNEPSNNILDVNSQKNESS